MFFFFLIYCLCYFNLVLLLGWLVGCWLVVFAFIVSLLVRIYNVVVCPILTLRVSARCGADSRSTVYYTNSELHRRVPRNWLCVSSRTFNSPTFDTHISNLSQRNRVQFGPRRCRLYSKRWQIAIAAAAIVQGLSYSASIIYRLRKYWLIFVEHCIDTYVMSQNK